MEDMLELVIRSLILSFILGICCQTFYETVAPKRKLRYEWLEHTTVFAFAAGIMVIAVTEIPPYIFQPIRLIVITAVVAQIYFDMRVLKNIILSITFCGIYWLFSLLFVLVVYITPLPNYVMGVDLTEPLVDIGYLCLMLAFRYCYQSKVRGLPDVKWGKFGLLSMIGIAVSVGIIMLSPKHGPTDYYALLTAVARFSVVYVLEFYCMDNQLEKECQMQNLRRLH